MHAKVKPTDLITREQAYAEYPMVFTAPSTWRHLISRIDQNGMARCFPRINNRYYVHVPSLNRWLEQQVLKAG